MSGSHTAANLTAIFDTALQQWDTDKTRVHVVLRDNARNMVKALDEGNLANLPCVVHTLQLVVNEGPSEASLTLWQLEGELLGILSTRRLHIHDFMTSRHSWVSPKKQLQQNVPTRWNSTYYMLQSLMERRRALGAYAAEHELPAMLNAHQWGLIENVLCLFAPFEELTKEISSSTAPAADVIPAITVLKRLLERSTDTECGVGTTKTTLLEAVQRRFSNTEKKPLYTLATALDPRYKNRYFSAEVKEQVKQVLLTMLERQTRHTPEEAAAEASMVPKHVTEAPAAKKPCSLMLSVHEEILQENAEVEQLLSSPSSVQAQSYLSELPISRSEKALTVSLHLLEPTSLTPCTSVDSERLFSLAGYVVDKRRNRLSSDKAEMLLLVKKNLLVKVNALGPYIR